MQKSKKSFDVAIIGTGFAGLAMATRLKREGRNDFVVWSVQVLWAVLGVTMSTPVRPATSLLPSIHFRSDLIRTGRDCSHPDRKSWPI